MKPSVSIVTPNYNGAPFLNRCLDSVEAQSFEDWEHIVVDDASSDDSVALIDARIERLGGVDAARLRLLRSSVNQGPRLARNRAVAAARGRYIAFLDSDDWWHPRKLEHQLRFMREGGWAISCHSYEQRGADGRDLGVFRVRPRIGYRRTLCVNMLSASTVVCDTQGMGDIRNHCASGNEDHVLWLRLLREYGDAGGLDEALSVYRMRAASRSRDKLAAAARRWRTYRDAERFGRLRSAAWFSCYALTALWRRIPWLLRR